MKDATFKMSTKANVSLQVEESSVYSASTSVQIGENIQGYLDWFQKVKRSVIISQCAEIYSLHPSACRMLSLREKVKQRGD